MRAWGTGLRVTPLHTRVAKVASHHTSEVCQVLVSVERLYNLAAAFHIADQQELLEMLRLLRFNKLL